MTSTEYRAIDDKSIDLNAYFHRIGYTGSGGPDAGALRQIVARHTEMIPFENLDPLLGRPVHLDARSLEQKLVRGGRGGYCFEHNLLLKHVLESLGFDVVGLTARVLWNTADDVITPRGHMLLLVESEGDQYIVDVGFGVLTLTAPLRLVPDLEQRTPHEPFRLLRAGEGFLLQAKLAQEWRRLYRFDLRKHHPPDYEITNWYLSNHPDSKFVQGLMVARAAPGRRYTLRDTELTMYTSAGRTEHRTLRNTAELRQTLADTFFIEVPAGLTSTFGQLFEQQTP